MSPVGPPHSPHNPLGGGEGGVYEPPPPSCSVRMIAALLAGLLFGSTGYHAVLGWCCLSIFVFMVSYPPPPEDPIFGEGGAPSMGGSLSHNPEVLPLPPIFPPHNPQVLTPSPTAPP